MTAGALALIILSAALHAGWNVHAKRRAVSLNGMFWATSVIAVALTPCAWLWPDITADLLRLWPWLIGTALCQTLYYAALIHAYRLGEVSAAYPLMRETTIVAKLPPSYWPDCCSSTAGQNGKIPDKSPHLSRLRLLNSDSNIQ